MMGFLIGKKLKIKDQSFFTFSIEHKMADSAFLWKFFFHLLSWPIHGFFLYLSSQDTLLIFLTYFCIDKVIIDLLHIRFIVHLSHYFYIHTGTLHSMLFKIVLFYGIHDEKKRCNENEYNTIIYV